MFAPLARRYCSCSSRGFHSSTINRFAANATAVAAAAQDTGEVDNMTMKLNFSCPRKYVFKGEDVNLVNVPGMTGVYGIAADMAPTISELRPGQVVVQKQEGSEPETFFVPAGFAVTHPGSKTDVVAADIVSRDEIDTDALRTAFEDGKKKLESQEEGTAKHAEAQIELDVYEAACQMLGISV
jgi:F0F1-type ATP synthase epsilon subunit